MKSGLLVSLFLLNLIEGFIALQWTQQSLANGTRLLACEGQDVTLAWNYVLLSDEQVLDTEWYYRDSNSVQNQLLATQITRASDLFLKDSAIPQSIEFVPNAGIRLLNAQNGHSGTYSVYVNVNQQGFMQPQVQTINLVVTAEALTTDGHLHAQLREATLTNSTEEYHVVLSCGTLNPIWASSVDIVWTTPDGHTLPSTSEEGGEFLLQVPTPVVSGQYTCKVANFSLAALCIQHYSVLMRGATVLVDICEVKLSVTRARGRDMEEQLRVMQNKIQSLEAQLHVQRPPDTGVSVRLVGGSSPREGRVEVWNGSSWGTVCDDLWDVLDAGVVCRELGFSSTNALPWGWASFGQGADSTMMDDVECVGNETSLLDCVHSGIGLHNCQHTEDAGVTCGADPIEIRLTGGANSWEGRIEILINGTWGTVCNRSFSSPYGARNAAVLCKQLGLPSFGATWTAIFGPGSGPVWLSNFFCEGTENNVLQCHAGDFSMISDHLKNELMCLHDHDVGLRCPESTIRLVDGSSAKEGRVEVWDGTRWGTVCDDDWDLHDAQVVCRQLGLTSISAWTNAHFGQGTGAILLDDVHCIGTETSLLDCNHVGFGNQNCGHNEDAGVSCRDYVIPRLVNGSNINEGRVEIWNGTHWGTVCDDYWDANDAQVVCRQLGLPSSGAVARGAAFFGQGTVPILMDDVQCVANEHELWECPHRHFTEGSCGHSEDAGVICACKYTSGSCILE